MLLFHGAQPRLNIMNNIFYLRAVVDILECDELEFPNLTTKDVCCQNLCRVYEFMKSFNSGISTDKQDFMSPKMLATASTNLEKLL